MQIYGCPLWRSSSYSRERNSGHSFAEFFQKLFKLTQFKGGHYLVLRPNKKIPVFSVTRPNLNLLVKPIHGLHRKMQ